LSPALRSGIYTSVDAADGVFAYTRRVEDASVVVALNMSDRPVETALNVPEELTSARRRAALGTHRRPQEPIDLRRLDLRPFEGVVIC